MKITPLDVRQKSFSTSFRGFAPQEVSHFMERLADELEEIVKENIDLKEELHRTSVRLAQLQDKERALQDTMVSAQKMSEDMKTLAKKEADILIAEAERQAEKVVEGANRRLLEVMGDIRELKRQRIQFESQLHSLIETHQKLLQTFSTPLSGNEGLEEKLSVLPRKRLGNEP